MRPVSTAYRISQPFGSMKTAGVAASTTPGTVGYYVYLYGNYQPYGHAGCDIACPEGTPVHAIAPGTVLWADWGTNLPGDESNAGYRKRWYLYKKFPGIVTIIQHAGWVGVYAHLSRAQMSAGDRVTEGQQIGLSGGTGGVAPHLHVEALADLNYTTGGGLIYGRTNPEPFFGSGEGMAAMGSTTPQASTIPEGFLMALTDDQQKDLYYTLCTAEGQQIRAQKDADVLLRTAVGMLDGGNPTFAELLAVSNDRLKHIKDGADLLPALDVDLRGDLANKGQQIAALTATVNTLAGLVGSEQGLDAEQIKQAVSEAIAAGIKITVSGA